MDAFFDFLDFSALATGVVEERLVYQRYEQTGVSLMKQGIVSLDSLRNLAVVFMIGVLGLATGCATVMEGSDQSVNVNITGCEEYGTVTCTLTNSEGSVVITAPASANVEKSKNALTVSCSSKDSKARGTQIVASKYETMNMGNVLAGGIIGLGVDAATGAMWKYPTTVVVPMSCEPKEG